MDCWCRVVDLKENHLDCTDSELTRTLLLHLLLSGSSGRHPPCVLHDEARWWSSTISLAIFSPSPPLGLPQVLDGGGLELWPLHTCSLAPTQGIRMGTCSGWWILTLAILRRSDGYKTKLEIGTRCSCLELFGRLITALCLLEENKYNRRRINEKFRLCFW